ncbi:MAG: zf-HC2 domain-containing protein [Gaiellaceae bacterium]
MGPAAHCLHENPAISRDLDQRLSWRERRGLHAHLRGCDRCADFARFQRECRAALRVLRLVAVPASLRDFRSPARE